MGVATGVVMSVPATRAGWLGAGTAALSFPGGQAFHPSLTGRTA
jgi:hypothetical protein